MRSSLLLLIAFPLLFSCNKVDVSPKEKTTVETQVPTSTTAQSPLVGNYTKLADDDSSRPMPFMSQLIFVDDTHQLVLRDKTVDLLYTGNPTYIATQQDFPYTPDGIARVEMKESADQTSCRINISYWSKDPKNGTYTVGATYRKN
jgi:hypothetical protein